MKLALITGGSKGLGKALVETYLENGWQVREFSRSGATPHNIHCDFADPVASASVLYQTFTALCEENWSEIVLINNVGTLQPMGPIHLDQAEDWQQNIQINLNSCITATGLFLKCFTDPSAKRSIANISSGAAVKPYYGWSLYCTSKAAMEAFTSCIAVEQSHNPDPVTAFIINPGVIDTDMQDLIRSQEETRFKDISRFKQLKADNNLQSPQRVAKAIYSITHSMPKAGEKYNVQDY